MISRVEALATVRELMRKEGFLMMDAPENPDGRMTAVFSACDVRNGSLAAVPIVISANELASNDAEQLQALIQIRVSNALMSYRELVGPKGPGEKNVRL